MPLGTLLFNLPLEILSSPQDLAKLDEFVDKIAEKLDVFHGYIGLAAIPPHNYYDGAPYEYGVCRENFGLIPVTTDYLSTFYRYNIRSISWYTLVGRELYGQLPAGRIEPVLANHPDIKMRDIAGIKVFKIGNLPETGDIHEDLPLDYIALNRALEPIREKYPRENMGGITREQMYYWSRRWDGVGKWKKKTASRSIPKHRKKSSVSRKSLFRFQVCGKLPALTAKPVISIKEKFSLKEKGRERKKHFSAPKWV